MAREVVISGKDEGPLTIVISTGDGDDGLAGDREPRRPKPGSGASGRAVNAPQQSL